MFFITLDPYFMSLPNNNVGTSGLDEQQIDEGTCTSFMHIRIIILNSLLETGIAKSPHMYGDLLLTPDQEKKLLVGGESTAQGFLYSARPWPNGIVPYNFDNQLSKLIFTITMLLIWSSVLIMLCCPHLTKSKLKDGHYMLLSTCLRQL